MSKIVNNGDGELGGVEVVGSEQVYRLVRGMEQLKMPSSI